jgi:cytochrome c-type biogenesis protein CcmE
MRIPHAKFLIAGGLIVAGLGYLMFSGIANSMVYYHTLSELHEQGARLEGRGIRISGHVQPGSILRDSTGSRVEFVVFEKDSDRTLPVAYQGLIPDTFKDDAEVVVEGIYDPASPVFQAGTLLAKCPSKYEGKAEEHPEAVSLE